MLEGTARRILSYAGDDAALRAMAAELHAVMPHYAEQAMSAMMRKQSLYASEAMAKGRSADNRARRRPTA